MAKKKILIVDDSPITQEQLSDILNDNGYETDIASNGLAAINRYKSDKDNIDLITLDITMPIMDGLETLKKLKEIDENVIVIMVSAMGKQKIIKECLDNGAKNFITKPFNKEKILYTIDSIFK